MRPSVGTWLNKAPKKGSVEPVSTSKPSPSIDAPFRPVDPRNEFSLRVQRSVEHVDCCRRDYYAAHVHSPPDLQAIFCWHEIGLH